MDIDKLIALDIDPKWLDPLMATFVKYNISTTQRQACFIGQCQHESNNFRTLEENLYYSAAGLMHTWPSRFPNTNVAEQFANNPEKIANKVYAGRFGNVEEGDGWKYRGRGLIQLTGRESYANCGASIGVNLIEQPVLLVTPKLACLSAGWFWNKKNLNALADIDDVKEITQRINGGLLGYEQRIERIELAKKALDTY
jgi:putative chitinase